ncbi:Aste57867_10095 [Aphanomyces stellatus]|uniref:Aste57867_10095 protein n=1 Tax=Aphanomyces stellatus TaxID=120398 RepID=A0A485KPY0_9STRA|nr:hypothetical protein As57867_010056 [Aphanomyces stellatus]VFT86971.1 Aste57867_10095 [Aphanomyces stellatus]
MRAAATGLYEGALSRKTKGGGDSAAATARRRQRGMDGRDGNCVLQQETIGWTGRACGRDASATAVLPMSQVNDLILEHCLVEVLQQWQSERRVPRHERRRRRRTGRMYLEEGFRECFHGHSVRGGHPPRRRIFAWPEAKILGMVFASTNHTPQFCIFISANGAAVDACAAQ